MKEEEEANDNKSMKEDEQTKENEKKKEGEARKSGTSNEAVSPVIDPVEKSDTPATAVKNEDNSCAYSFVPSILPEWNKTCGIDEKANQVDTMELTDENARSYAGISSYVGWKGRVDYALDHLEKDSDLDGNLLSCLLESVISTVIVMACGGTPPDNYLISSILYLRYVRNEFGEHPPNIAAFLEYLKQKSPDAVHSALESIGEPDVEDVPHKVVITPVPKVLQQRLCK